MFGPPQGTSTGQGKHMLPFDVLTHLKAKQKWPPVLYIISPYPHQSSIDPIYSLPLRHGNIGGWGDANILPSLLRQREHQRLKLNPLNSKRQTPTLSKTWWEFRLLADILATPVPPPCLLGQPPALPSIYIKKSTPHHPKREKIKYIRNVRQNKNFSVEGASDTETFAYKHGHFGSNFSPFRQNTFRKRNRITWGRSLNGMSCPLFETPFKHCTGWRLLSCNSFGTDGMLPKLPCTTESHHRIPS